MDTNVTGDATAATHGPASVGPATRPAQTAGAAQGSRIVLGVVLAVSVCHLLNDLIQSLLPAIYPILKTQYALSFAQVGLITMTFQITASLLQPVVGVLTDRRPMPFSLAIGMGSSLIGLLLLSRAGNFAALLIAAGLVGVGSSIFHPESSRVARMASGGRYGLAQSIFQVGGNTGTALGPLLAAFIVVPHGQHSIALFSLAALLGMTILARVGLWYRGRVRQGRRAAASRPAPAGSRARVTVTIVLLLALIFSKFFYMASLSSYYTFYLIDRFGVSVEHAQLLLFLFLGAVAAGTIMGGPIGDRIGRRAVIWASIGGVLPLTLILPHVGLVGTAILSVPIGLILASAFPAIIVYAQELLPGNVGMVAGLFFGFAFGMGGLGAALLGQLADATSIETVYRLCAFLPAIGLLAVFLPRISPAHLHETHGTIAISSTTR